MKRSLSYSATGPLTIFLAIAFTSESVDAQQNLPTPPLANDTKIKTQTTDEVYRTWTSADGSKTVQAQVVDLVERTVTLRRNDGKSFSLPIQNLSAADQAFLLDRFAKLPRLPSKLFGKFVSTSDFHAPLFVPVEQWKQLEDWEFETLVGIGRGPLLVANTILSRMNRKLITAQLGKPERISQEKVDELTKVADGVAQPLSLETYWYGTAGCGFVEDSLVAVFFNSPRLPPNQLMARQSSINRDMVRIRLPKSLLPDERLVAVYVLPGTTEPAEKLILMPEGQVETAIASSLDLRKRTGLEGEVHQVGATFENGTFDIVSSKNTHGNVGVYAVARVRRGTPGAHLASVITYFRPTSWATQHEGIIEVPLPNTPSGSHETYLPPKCRLMLSVVSGVGGVKSKATVEILRE